MTGPIALLVIIIVVIGVPIATLIVRSRRNDELVPGGSFGDQLRRRKHG